MERNQHCWICTPYWMGTAHWLVARPHPAGVRRYVGYDEMHATGVMHFHF